MKSLRWLGRPLLRCGAPGLLVALVAACASSSPVAGPHFYDFGAAPATNPAPKSPGTLVVPMAETSSWLDSSAVGYRLNYARSNQPMVYANSHWTMPPAELITRRIRSQLATQTNVIATTDSLKDPVLQVEVEEFTQIFDTPEQSHAIVRLRATVVRDGRVLDQRTFWVEAPAPTPDAAGGVAALTSASNNAISELAAWAGGVLR